MKQKTIRTLCQFCHTNCGILIHKDTKGKLSVEGDPDHPVNRGRCCRKASAIPELIFSKDRLTAPLKKTPTGFKKISWDEALQFAADKLGEIRSNHGPQSLLRYGGAPVSYECRDGFMQFMGEYGSPNFTGDGNLCMVPRMTAFEAVTGGRRADPDYEKTGLVIFWGTNPLASERYGSFSSYNGMREIIPRLKKRGIRIINIDPFRTATVRQSDEWIRIRPGSDVALGLAMMHVIIKEDLYDHSFVRDFTQGFDALGAHIESCSPKWAEPLTGISEKTIRDLARTYATTKPALIYEGNGLDMYTNGVDSARTVAMLIALTGNLDRKGGNVFMPYTPQSVLPTRPCPREKRIDFRKFPLFLEVPFPSVKDVLLGGKEDCPRALIVHHSNPVLTQANEKRTRQAFEKLDFMMVADIFPTATSEMADLVLPVTSDFEGYGYRAYASAEGGFLALARPVVEPVGDARSVFDVEYELAQKMGFHENYPFSDTKSWIEFMLKPCGVPFEHLEKEQIVYATPPIRYEKYIAHGFNTPSGKVEFSSSSFEKSGYTALPSYTEPAGEPLHAEDISKNGYSLLGTTQRLAQFVHTKFRNLETLTRLYPEPLVLMHPQDASGRGIAEGDAVEVSSPTGKIRLKATLTEDTSLGLVWIDFGWGNPTDGKANINLLTSDAHFDPVSGGTPNRLFPCDIQKQQT